MLLSVPLYPVDQECGSGEIERAVGRSVSWRKFESGAKVINLSLGGIAHAKRATGAHLRVEMKPVDLALHHPSTTFGPTGLSHDSLAICSVP